MTGPIARSFVEVVPDLRNFTGRLRAGINESTALAQRSVGTLGNTAAGTASVVARESEGMFARLKGQIKSVAAFALPMLGAIEGYKFFKESVAAARMEERQLRQTEAVLKSTGGVANVTAKGIEELAKKQSMQTGITQTQVRTNANMLLTFTKIRNEAGKGNDIFNQATMSVNDLAVAMKEGPRAAAIQLGKALNEPVTGLTALRRVGVSFTDSQKEMIKALVKGGQVNALNAVGFNITESALNKLAKDGYGGDINKAVQSLTDHLSKSQKTQYEWLVKGGHTAQAQKMILHEINKEFGGSAAAQGTAGQKMAATWETVRIAIGEKLLPVINTFEGVITKRVLPGVLHLLEQAGKGEGVFGALSKVFHVLVDVLKPLVAEAMTLAREAWPMIQKALAVVIPALETTAHWLKEHATLVRTVAVMVVAFWAAWKGYKIIMAVKDAMMALNIVMAENPVGIVIAAIAALVAGFMYAYTHSETFRKIIARVFAVLKEGVATVVRIGKEIWQFGKSVLNGLVSGFQAVIAFFADFPNKVLQFFRNAPKWLVDAGVWLIKGLAKGIVLSFVLMYELIKLHIEAVIFLFVNAPKWLWAAGKLLIEGLWLGIQLAWKGIVWFFTHIPKYLLEFFVTVNVWLFKAGVAILEGLWNGIVELYHKAIEPWFGGLPTLIANFFRNALAWLKNAGQAVIRGLWHGIGVAWTTIADWFHAIGAWFKGIFTNALGWLLGAGRWIIRGLWNGIKAVWDTVSTWFSNLPGMIANFFIKAATWLYEGGKNIILGIWHGLENSFSAIGNWFKKLPGRILSALGIASPPKWAVEAGKWIIKAIIQGAASTVKDAQAFFHNFRNVISPLLEQIGLPGGTLNIGTVSGGTSHTALQDLAGKMFASYGWGKNQQAELSALIQLWNHESGWNYRATNSFSGAYGIPQSLPADKMASAGADWRTNPLTQIRWGLGYIKSAYGDPINAWYQWQNRFPHWYEKGAWSIPGMQLAALHRGEMVVPQPQAQKFRDALQQTPRHGAAEIDYEKLGRAVARALGGVELAFDSAGMVRFVNSRNGITAIRGVRQ